jgi:deoxyribonuclease-1-like protein
MFFKPSHLIRKIIIVFFLFVSFLTTSQIKMLSWNLQNFGKSKTDNEIKFIADIVKDYDVVAIVEVVAGYGGAQAVARLADELNRKGSKWEYVISEPTSGTGKTSERYAFLWKPHKLKRTGEARLEEKYHSVMDREPYYATFEASGKKFSLAAFHAVPKSKQPEREIKYFKFIIEDHADKNLIICGDFNCPQSHNVFNPIKGLGYSATLLYNKTTLKQEVKNGESLASEFDNIFYDTNKVKAVRAGIVHFYKAFPTLKLARQLTDHVPVYLEFSLN